MIDEDRTMQLYGYYSTDLKPKSNKLIVKICDDCGKYSISPKHIYSDLCKSCIRKGENSPEWKGGLITKTCEICDKEFKSAQSQNQKFCSVKCYGKWKSINQKGKNNVNWQGGITQNPYCKLFNESFKTKIRNKFNNKCFLCGKTKQDEGKNLAVHHVNYNKNCLCGSNCEFVPLCTSCHAKTNGNRQYWENLIMCYLYQNRYFMIDL